MGLLRRKPSPPERVVDLRFGRPGDCPTCKEHASLEHIDLVDRVSRHHCFVCDETWWIAESHPGVALPIKP